MNFKEIFKRYQEGNASPDEIEMIERELSKYEAIEEYYAENIPEKLFEREAEEAEETESIQKVVNQRLRKVVLTAVLIVVGLYIAVFIVGSRIVDQFYYDPTTISQPVEEELLGQSEDYIYDMAASISLNEPGNYFVQLANPDSKGFGTYDLYYGVYDSFTEEVHDFTRTLTRNRFISAQDHNYYSYKNDKNAGFSTIYYPMTGYEDEAALKLIDKQIEDQNETTLQSLEELAPSSYVSMNLVFGKDLSMAELLNLKEEYSNLNFDWVGVHVTEPGTRWKEDQPNWLIGFNPDPGDYSLFFRPDPEEYPYFFLVDFMMQSGSSTFEEVAEYHEEHFKSRLKYISERDEFVEFFEERSNKNEFYAHALDYVETNGIEIYGVLVYATAEDFLEVLEELPYDSIYINDVLPAKPYLY